MQLNRRALKKRKGNIRHLIGISLGCLFLFLLILGCYYFIVHSFLGPVYVSPLSKFQGLNIASQTDSNAQLVDKLLKEKSIQYSKIELTPDAIIITVDKDKLVTLSQKKDVTEQISSLQFILSRLTMEGREFKSLDLRYDKPIIVLEK